MFSAAEMGHDERNVGPFMMSDMILRRARN